ncbi:hypothetical protein L0N33_23570 [Roseburia faecis]|nr:hypothetical protein [Roseburia faecis]
MKEFKTLDMLPSLLGPLVFFLVKNIF